MRIVAGAWRGRRLVVPPGAATRPTADRVRQALFDMLAHAPWASPDGVRGEVVLDVFAGTGALGLEALSRGAARATFIERDRAALIALRTNIETCRAENVTVLEADTRRLPAAAEPATLVFLDPPYASDDLSAALAVLWRLNWIAENALLVIETARDDPLTLGEPLASRTHGAARISFFSAGAVPRLPAGQTARPNNG